MGFFKRMWKKAAGAVKRMKSAFDKEGSYTGSPDERANGRDEKPEQDADDL